MAEKPTQYEGMASPAPKRRKRYWGVRLLIWVVALGFLYGIIVGGMGLLYHGPSTLPEMASIMPGVPVFPFADVSRANRSVQRGLAVPLLLLRRQGATRAEAVLLQAPADHDFVVEWYQQASPTQAWKQIGQAQEGERTRLIFQREHEALQVTIGATVDGLATPVQYIYLDGVSGAMARQLVAAAPRPTAVPPTPTVTPRPNVPIEPPSPPQVDDTAPGGNPMQPDESEVEPAQPRNDDHPTPRRATRVTRDEPATDTQDERPRPQPERRRRVNSGRQPNQEAEPDQGEHADRNDRRNRRVETEPDPTSRRSLPRPETTDKPDVGKSGVRRPRTSDTDTRDTDHR